jgi:hypothetical protein
MHTIHLTRAQINDILSGETLNVLIDESPRRVLISLEHEPEPTDVSIEDRVAHAGRLSLCSTD